MPIELYYHLFSPPARACVIAAKYLGIDVVLKEVDFLAQETRTPQFIKINPTHTVPALVDNGLFLFESRAIMAYFVNKYCPGSELYPQDAAARALVDKILYFDASAFYPNLQRAFMPKYQLQQDPPQETLDELKEKLQIFETLLGDQNFIAGKSATLADISLSVSIPIVKSLFPHLLTPNMEAWYERVIKAVPQVHQFNTETEEKQKNYKF